MNFIKQIMAFDEYQENDHVISNNASLLWFLLMIENNKKYWAEWFAITNGELLHRMNYISRQSLNKARNELIELGFIEYKKGKRNVPSKYKIKKLYKENSSQLTDVLTDQYTDQDTHMLTDQDTDQLTDEVTYPLTDQVTDVLTDEDTHKDTLPTSNLNMLSEVTSPLTDKDTDLLTDQVTDLLTDQVTQKTDSSLYNKLYINKNKNINKNINKNKTDIPEVEKNNQVNELNGINKEIASFRDEALKKALAENDKLEQEKQNNVDKSTTPSKAKDRKTKKTKKEPLFDKTELMNFFNDHRNRMKKLIKFSDNRVTAVNARIKEYSKEQVREVILKAEQSDFLNGLTGDGSWIANFDWLMKKSNFLKVLEGNYDNPPITQSKNKPKDFLWETALGEGFDGESEVVI